MYLDDLYLTHYYYKDCEPLKNIMLLDEKEAFETAARLAQIHRDTTSFYRFSDLKITIRAEKALMNM